MNMIPYTHTFRELKLDQFGVWPFFLVIYFFSFFCVNMKTNRDILRIQIVVRQVIKIFYGIIQFSLVCCGISTMAVSKVLFSFLSVASKLAPLLLSSLQT